MVSGSDIIKMARTFNGYRHYGGRAPTVDAQRLKRVGEVYEILMAMQDDPFYAGAITVCTISKRRKDGSYPVFKKCSLYTAAVLFVYILEQHGFIRDTGFSQGEAETLQKALQEGDAGEVGELYRGEWRCP